MGETEDNVSPVGHLVLVSSCVLVIMGNALSNVRKTWHPKYNSVGKPR